MDFIIGLLNNIYKMIISILEAAGVKGEFPEDLIPTTTQAAE